MSKITRALQKLFANNAGNPADNVAQFGSLKAGATAYSLDPATIQALAAWDSGWKGAVVNNNAPALQDLNAVLFLFSRQIAYLMQAGVPEYDAATTYYVGSIVQDGSGRFFRSVIDDNLAGSLTDTSQWLALGAAEYKATGFTAELNRRYLADTSAAGFTATLPASPVTGDSVSFYDGGGVFGTKNLTLGRNGNKINGAAADYPCNLDGMRAELVFVNPTIGWRVYLT